MLAVNERLGPSAARIVAYLDNFSLTRDLRQARLASHKGMISLREPHKGVILQVKGAEELRPFCEAGRTLMPSVLDKAFKGEL